jgi:septum formation protein
MKRSLILASSSPRRKFVLETLSIPHETVTPDCVEPARFPNEKPHDFCCRAAYAKVLSVAKNYPDQVVLSADTIVVIDNRILGKPESKKEAREMITLLSGQKHSVFSGIAFLLPFQTPVLTYCETRVLFRNLSEDEINWYTESGDGFDKAGAYGIQSLGGSLVKEIHGDWFNVVGLPAAILIELLCRYCSDFWPPKMVQRT